MGKIYVVVMISLSVMACLWAFYTTLVQKRWGQTQQKGMDKLEVSLEMQRQALALQARTNELLEEISSKLH